MTGDDKFTIIRDRVEGELYIYNQRQERVAGPFDTHEDARAALAELVGKRLELPTKGQLDFLASLPARHSRPHIGGRDVTKLSWAEVNAIIIATQRDMAG